MPHSSHAGPALCQGWWRVRCVMLDVCVSLVDHTVTGSWFLLDTQRHTQYLLFCWNATRTSLLFFLCLFQCLHLMAHFLGFFLTIFSRPPPSLHQELPEFCFFHLAQLYSLFQGASQDLKPAPAVSPLTAGRTLSCPSTLLPCLSLLECQPDLGQASPLVS